MAERVRCKACGYVTDASKAGDVCPACGAPRKSMESWKDPVEEKRRFLLSFDAHPLILHFSIAFVTSAFLLSLAILAFPVLFEGIATQLLVVFVGVLPLAVIATFLTGLLDGKARFRRVSTPLLVRKIVLGLLFFVASGAAAAIAFTVGLSEAWPRLAVAVLLAVGFLCAALLGRVGKGLVAAILPG